jgi:hypothetical protein
VTLFGDFDATEYRLGDGVREISLKGVDLKFKLLTFEREIIDTVDVVSMLDIFETTVRGFGDF